MGLLTPTVVLFDWDGTVVDSRKTQLACWYESTQNILGRRFPETRDEHALVLRERGVEVFAAIAADGEQADQLAAAFDAAYSSHRVRAFGAVSDALEVLRRQGARLGVVTSKARSRFTPDALSTQLKGLFEVVVCGEDVTRPKPDPEGVRLALARMCADPAVAVMVGDSVSDLEAGRAAGARTVAAEWGYGDTQLLRAVSDASCARPEALPALINDLVVGRVREMP